MEKVSFEQIEQFLEGSDPQQYIVGIESSYSENLVYLIINDPETGKRIEPHKFKPFVWVKEEVVKRLYGGNRRKIQEVAKKNNIRFKKLRTLTEDGEEPERMANGYKYLVTITGHGYSKLQDFFRNGGVDARHEDNKKLFTSFSPDEQFLIQTGKRLFKGMDDYNDVHRLQFDLETEGLDPVINGIFQIGIKDNKGYERILETKGENGKERRESERANIKEFFQIVYDICPDIITAYNSENFDWPFIEKRCERLGIDFYDIVKTLNPNVPVKRKDAMLKLGGEQEAYKQTYIWGTSVLDISHSVRRAQAINSSIKKWSLKYITQYSGVAKPNRVYVDGDVINKTWADARDHWFNESNGKWGLLENSEYIDELPEGVKIVKGDYIVQRYLLDDLWETEQVDGIYNQAAYLIAKILPTSYMRSSTMGTAGQWKLIMAAWSYQNNLGVPDLQKKREFTGGLSRLLEVGFAKNVVKADFAALYPKTELTHGIFPSLDISGVMEGLLTYVVDKRDEFKFLTSEHKDKAKELATKLEERRDTLTPEEIEKVEKAIKKHKKLASNYDKKQLPLKILANSFFGAYGAPYIFNWGDSDCAEETTCRGRQYLRLMVRFFTEKYGFRALVLDTDGCNFAIPDNVDEIKYITQASHWKTNHYEVGQELTGLDAVLAEFNETYMLGRMGLDIDDICDATINFARKNYANDIDGKVKLVGNSIKSKAMPEYIEEFIDKGVRMLLDDKGYDFIEYYYEHVNKIYSYQMPVLKMASKSRVKMTPKNYVDVYCKGTNKAGAAKARQAYMELILVNNLDVNLGDTIYYINTGEAKSHSDIKAVKDKATGQTHVEFNCKLIPQEQIDMDPNLINTEYNIPKYLDAFNKRIKPLLVCFDTDIRHNIIINVVKDKKTKLFMLEERGVFTEKQCKLIAGKPFEESDQDSYEALMTMEDKEIRFWDSVNKLPNNMEEEEWERVRTDYHERLAKMKADSIAKEKETFDIICKNLKQNDFQGMSETGMLVKELQELFSIDEETGYIVSNKWEVIISTIDKLFDYLEVVKEREIFMNAVEGDFSYTEKFNMWLDTHNSDDELEDDEVIEDETIGIMKGFLTENQWIEVMDGYWCTMELYNSGSDYYRSARTLEEAYQAELGIQKSLERAKSQEKNGGLVITKDEDDEWNF
jgi:DNA polymerase elongation subunit (family B)